ncbi:zona pellucida-binding protein 1 isoform X2 [Peromyscus leucopus]|uniref:zona pellucida-binding protein 1 isoform X2 n=1 Tax=Peromyscus leucopus TaxID=10041 RepID=UPI0018854B16|nr:zona pellucida-binding protein 1 isoform X2 [Peromyscus leucopus]
MCAQASSQASTPAPGGPSGSGGVSVGPSFRPAVRQLPAAGGRAPGNGLQRRGSAGGGGVWMEALAPGRAPRGRRRAGAAGSTLSALSVAAVLLSALLRAPPAVGYLARLPRSFRLIQDSLKIVGSSHFPENSTAQVTSTGSLIFQNFEETMSGVYTCFLEYKPTVEEVVKNLQLKYVIYAYREPHFYYQFTARYHAAPCNSIYNISFEKKLLQILSKLVLDLSCEVSLLKSECHRIKMQRAGLQNELFFTFSVSSIDTDKGTKPCTEPNCDTSKRLSKAKNLIERFFNQQVEVLGKRVEPLPEIYYIEGTLQMVWINRCYPGYGINDLKHPRCPECCVICSPGSYNPRDGTHCLQCNSSMVYGAKACA